MQQTALGNLEQRHNKKKFYCEICLKGYSSQWSMQRHIKTIHNREKQKRASSEVFIDKKINKRIKTDDYALRNKLKRTSSEAFHDENFNKRRKIDNRGIKRKNTINHLGQKIIKNTEDRNQVRQRKFNKW